MGSEGIDTLVEEPRSSEDTSRGTGPRPRQNLAWLKTLTPVLAAGVALVIHRWVPNLQNATPTGIYSRLLIGVMILFALLTLTHRLWRHMTPTWRNFPVAAVFN